MIHFPQCFYINLKNNHLGLIQINKKNIQHLNGAFTFLVPFPAGEFVEQCKLEPPVCTAELKGYSPKVYTSLTVPIYLCHGS